MTGGAVSLRGLVKSYAGTPPVLAVDRLDLEVHSGEFFSLLGESGCGKTTTLRMIAGFEDPDAGEILLDGADLTRVAAHRRPVNTVFQSYALFPFLNVWENVAFGLKYAGVTGAAAKGKVGRALELVEMSTLASRRPHQLSGGQQQRVALARALVLEPKVLLLDEPLGALDARLRASLQTELRALQQAVRTTFVYVTHDQEEALTMSDRLAVLVNGRVEQVGTPSQVYGAPESAYVATFLGNANLWPGVVSAVDRDRVSCRVGEWTISASGNSVAVGQRVSVMVRPERVTVLPPEAASEVDTIPAQVRTVTYRGARSLVALTAGSVSIEAELAHAAGETPRWVTPGTAVACLIPAEAVRLLSAGEADDVRPSNAGS